MNQNNEKDIDNLLAIFDNFAASDTGRLKILMSEDVEPESTKRAYHHGRCDIGSPWAKGEAFDVLE